MNDPLAEELRHERMRDTGGLQVVDDFRMRRHLGFMITKGDRTIIHGLLRAIDGKFNTGERLEKLKQKERSLREIGNHKEAATFKAKINELSSEFNEKHPRDDDGKFAESGSTSGASSKPKESPKSAAPAKFDSKELSKCKSALKEHGYEESEFSPGVFMAKKRDGMHSFRIDKDTGKWKYYGPWDAPSTKGSGVEALLKELASQKS